MTLIACLHPKNGRALLADSLICSADSRDDLMVPTRVYIPLQRLREMLLRPVDLRRKVIEIRPDLVALWSGKGGLAETFARRTREWFKYRPPSEDEMRLFLDAHYHDRVEGLSVIMVSALTPIYFMVGSVVRSSAPFAGEYAVAGTGKEILVNMVNEMQPREDEALSPAMDALRIANDLLAREIVTKDTIWNGFSGAYEVLYQGPKGFERVDDVMHAFASVNLNTMEIGHYPHALRQWYEGDNYASRRLQTRKSIDKALNLCVLKFRTY
jgi:hypothetical protein